MNRDKSYFFCGIGGSGMLPLACIVRDRGDEVAGSDRSLDQGRVAEKFAFLERRGIRLFPQDGSGVTSADQILVTSAAVEETVPDVQAARRLGAEQLTRPQLLAQLFNAAGTAIAVGGTSGKSTTTGMIGWILQQAGLDPTVMNGAVMKNFVTPDTPFASALWGKGNVFVSEVDESDGSIALYEPGVAVLNNITLDHKSLEELRTLFRNFVSKAQTAVLNLDDDETRLLAAVLPPETVVTFGFKDKAADLFGSNVEEEPLAISFDATDRRGGRTIRVRLGVPGRHNAANALAAMLAVQACGVELERAAAELAGFKGLRRRFEVVGTKNGITVIDDFGHNPDKIAATLDTLHAFPGRVLMLFQPHGYGPLKTMKQELIDCFAQKMAPEDVLIMPDPVYFGGTVERTVGSGDIVAGVRAAGRQAEHIADRAACGDRLVQLAKPGDRIIVMGARDDTLSQFAADALGSLMSKYGAIVSWTSDGDFTSGRYSRGHEWRFDGGAVVRGSSSPHVVPAYSDPAGVDPEEALIASASACHMLWFLSLAQGAGFDVASYRDAASGTMGKDDRGKIAVTRITLAPEIVFIGREPTAEELDRLHHDAHERCFISNSLRTEIVVEAAR